MKRILHKDVFFSTVFGFVALSILKLITYNIHIFDPITASISDFEATDIIFSRFHEPHKIAVDTNVFLVNIGNNNRDLIAEQIRVLKRHKPKVIALDATFLKNSSEDSILKIELDNTPQLITASFFNYKSEQSQEADTLLGSVPEFNLNGREGYVNFRVDNSENTVRLFTPFIKFKEKEYYSFSSRIISKYKIEAFNKLRNRNHPVEIINYKGNIYGDSAKFIAFDVNEINDSNVSLSQIRNKIVLMGFMGHDLSKPILEDIHFTPLNKAYSGRSQPDMYGVVIHANILSTILYENNFIDPLNKYLLWVLAFIICYVHMYYFIISYMGRGTWYHLYTKIAQLVSASLIVFIALLLFKYCNIKINTTLIILPIVISVDLLYLYVGFVKYLSERFGYQTYFVRDL